MNQSLLTVWSRLPIEDGFCYTHEDRYLHEKASFRNVFCNLIALNTLGNFFGSISRPVYCHEINEINIDDFKAKKIIYAQCFRTTYNLTSIWQNLLPNNLAEIWIYSSCLTTQHTHINKFSQTTRSANCWQCTRAFKLLSKVYFPL